MSGDTDKAKISDNQDEDKKSGAGDGQTTEDESSQDSKGESVPMQPAGQGNADVDTPNEPDLKLDGPPETGDGKSTTANGKDDEGGDDSKEDLKDDSKEEEDTKKEENGETHDDDDDKDEEEEVKEKNSKPAKKQPVKKKPSKKEETEEEDEEEEEEEEEEGEGEEDEEEEKPKEKAAKKPAKKPAKKEKAEEEGEDDEEEGEEEGEEEEEEEEEAPPKPKPKKEPTEPPVPVPAGKGIPLGHIGNVEISLSRFKTHDQKLLHQYLYGQLCLDRNVKRNIKKFKGYEWTGSAEYNTKLEETTKMEPKQLRTLCEMLDLDKKGSPSDLSGRLVAFLQQPGPNSIHARTAARAAPAPAATPGGRPRRAAAVKVQHRGYSDEEYESDPSTKVKSGPKPAIEGSEDSDGSFNPSGSEEADSDFDPEAGEGVPGPGRKRKVVRRPSKPGKRGRRSGSGKGKKGKGGSSGGKKPSAAGGRGRRAKSESEDESDKSESESEEHSASEGEDSDEPKSKRGRAPPAVVNKGGRKPAPAKNAKATPVKRKAPTPTGNKKKAAASKPAGRPPAKRGRKDESEEESGDDDERSDDDASDDDDAGDKPKRPPTDDEIRKYVKQILEGANLEEITMKTVCKQVYSHYPDFDLAHKKDFIKATVKSCI